MRNLTILVVVILAAGARAEAPKLAEQQFKNIQVFKGVSASQIDPTMDVMAGALGVQCNFCHVVGGKNQPPAMEKDDKEAKRTARKMVTMMQKINHDFFGDNQVVTCATCHNGRPQPRQLPPLEAVAGPPEPDEDAKPPALTAKQLLDKWVQASGGAAAWGKLRTRVSKGKIEGFGPQPFGVELVQAAPDRWHLTLTMPNGTFDQAWDGKEGWRRFGGKTRPLDDVDEARRQTQLAPPLALPKLLTGLKVAADAPLGKGTAHVLEGRQGDARVRLWLDAQTGLLARMTVRLPTPVGDLPQQSDFEDYRGVDGVKLPFVIKSNQGGRTSTETFSEIKHGPPVDDAQFARPKDAAPPPPAAK